VMDVRRPELVLTTHERSSSSGAAPLSPRE
jgi:hypothetical protein